MYILFIYLMQQLLIKIDFIIYYLTTILYQNIKVSTFWSRDLGSLESRVDIQVVGIFE